MKLAISKSTTKVILKNGQNELLSEKFVAIILVLKVEFFVLDNFLSNKFGNILLWETG